MTEFIELHNKVRDIMKTVKQFKEKKKTVEKALIYIFEEHQVNVFDLNKNNRIYRYSNPNRLTVYHVRNISAN